MYTTACMDQNNRPFGPGVSAEVAVSYGSKHRRSENERSGCWPPVVGDGARPCLKIVGREVANLLDAKVRAYNSQVQLKLYNAQASML